MDIRDIIKTQLRFFKEQALLEEIQKEGQIVEVEPGTPILNEGSYVKTVPLLLNGLVKVVRVEGGKEMLLYYIYPLESCIVSIQCGLNDIKSRVKAISEDHSNALLIPARLVADWQRKYPSFNDFILNLYQKRFFDLLDAYNELAFQRLDERLLSYLQAKSNALSSRRLEMTHQDLGDELGTARESVSRVLKKLESEGRVKLHRGLIEII